jgi:TatD DNase family protein
MVAMTNTWVDTHAHIYLNELKADRHDIIQRAIEKGVTRILMPNIDHTSIDDMLEVESRYPDHCTAMMGLHPCSVKKGFEKELYLVEEWLFKRKFVALGEMGTDLYWDKTFWEGQKEAFRIQVEWAKKLDLPLVIHCRESVDETLELLEPLKTEKLRGVFHCFTGTPDQAKRVVDLGFHFGLGGVATFKNGGLDQVIPDLEPGSLLMETDSPYLAPVPHRGKRNEPSYIPIIAEKVGLLKKVTIEELASLTTRNAMRLFNYKTPS